ncbi:hypothetical protein D4764_01G0017430 [Takifugu flavidus]|uniref:Uncharacterized protein n=1 Tax=Takifugu flavidus TaxID=433684 RepID=A0A5C6PT14_9TELE|nr:hypothetical protein D4764_01G0017430 [Takifugu flavidus]
MLQATADWSAASAPGSGFERSSTQLLPPDYQNSYYRSSKGTDRLFSNNSAISNPAGGSSNMEAQHCTACFRGLLNSINGRLMASARVTYNQPSTVTRFKDAPDMSRDAVIGNSNMTLEEPVSMVLPSHATNFNFRKPKKDGGLAAAAAPKIATSSEAGGEPSDAPTLFTPPSSWHQSPQVAQGPLLDTSLESAPSGVPAAARSGLGARGKGHGQQRSQSCRG